MRELICIGCPMGCALSVEMNGNEVLKITGNTCKRGETYARKEVANPTRILTSTVRVQGESMLSVKTARDIPKGKIMECIRQLKKIAVKPPVYAGDIILENAAGTGVAVVATKNIPQSG